MLSKCNLNRCNLSKCSLNRCSLNRCNLNRCSLDRYSLSKNLFRFLLIMLLLQKMLLLRHLSQSCHAPVNSRNSRFLLFRTGQQYGLLILLPLCMPSNRMCLEQVHSSPECNSKNNSTILMMHLLMHKICSVKRHELLLHLNQSMKMMC
ncbi:MAG: pentapeptide repeat-containing protein [Oscillospiraceae bacterium]|nr:pentapeptide repeat-containing protein [Oscillospiraceae bacterium]